MTAPIAPIAAIAPLSATPTAPAASAASSGSFASVLGQSLDEIQSTQNNASNLAVQAATGNLTDPAQLTVATTQATLMTQLAATVEDKAVTAINTVMGMQA